MKDLLCMLMAVIRTENMFLGFHDTCRQDPEETTSEKEDKASEQIKQNNKS